MLAYGLLSANAPAKLRSCWTKVFLIFTGRRGVIGGISMLRSFHPLWNVNAQSEGYANCCSFAPKSNIITTSIERYNKVVCPPIHVPIENLEKIGPVYSAITGLQGTAKK